MPGKWQILNGVKYPAEGFESDCAFPRSTEEEKTRASPAESQCRSLSASARYNLRGKERVSQVPREMRTRTGTDYRQPLLHKNVDETTINEKPRSMLDRWMDGADFSAEPEVEPVEEPEEMQCHPTGWTKKNHYSELGWQWCGQSCPCCRARVGDTLGACPICIRERE